MIQTFEELDVSGGTPLAKREGLRAAVEAIEAHEAEVVVAAYFDRLVRSLRVQDELVSRVEDAGGRVMAVDVGDVSSASPGRWLQATMLGMVAEYHRRSARERVGGAQARAIARGVPTMPYIPPGYSRREDRTLEPNEDAPAILRAFQMRADGATIRQVRVTLAERGIERSYHGVQAILRSRIYLGELHFGELVNAEAHDPIIPAELWDRVQRVRVPRGRRAKSARLLARLGVLRCESCGGAMVVGTVHSRGRDYPIYRCSPTSDCPQRFTILAHFAEGVVTEAVRKAITDEEGRASTERSGQEAEANLERAQAELDAAIRAFTGLEDERAVVERLRNLRAARDATAERVDHLRGLRSAVRIRAGTDWDRLSLDARRSLIQLVIARAVVGPGKGASRVRVDLVTEDAPSLGVEDPSDLGSHSGG